MKRRPQDFAIAGLFLLVCFRFGSACAADECGNIGAKNLIRNGDFKALEGWELSQSIIGPRSDDSQKFCVKVAKNGQVIQRVPVEGGTVYQIYDLSKGTEHFINTQFYDNGKELPGRGYMGDSRGCYFFDFSASSNWAQNRQRLLAPKEATQLFLRILPKADVEESLYLAEVEVKEDILRQMSPKTDKDLILVENFEGFPEVEANNGRFRPGYTRVDFMPGKCGNAAVFSANNGIYFPLIGLLESFNEGTIEFSLKVETTSARPSVVWQIPFEERNGINRLEVLLTSPKNMVLRLSGASPAVEITLPGAVTGWYNCAVAWKANQGKGKDFVSFYLEGKKEATIDHCAIELIPPQQGLEKCGLSVGEVSQGCRIWMDELKIYRIARDYSVQELE